MTSQQFGILLSAVALGGLLMASVGVVAGIAALSTAGFAIGFDTMVLTGLWAFVRLM